MSVPPKHTQRQRRIIRHDFCAMQEVAEQLNAAAENIEFVSLTWPVHDGPGPGAALDLQLEATREWVSIVVERLQAWAKRAQAMTAALERSGRHDA
jgi:predicted nucleic acid-binding Zn ribbon protein